MKPRRWLLVFLIAVFYILAFALYSRMPDPMVTHWDSHGVANGYMSRFWGMFLVPFMITGITLLLLAVPNIDPLKSNITRFRGTYEWFIVFFVFYFLYIYVISLLWNAGYHLDFMLLLVPAMAIFFFLVGELISKAKRNYFIGIRTPWTLASDEVWDRTHRVGGRLFKIGAVITLLGIFFPKLAVWFLLVPLSVVSVAVVVLSYVYFRQLGGKSGTSL